MEAMPRDYSKKRESYCLNGLWSFSPCAESIDAYPPVTWDPEPIKVPSPYNINAFTPSRVRRYAGQEVFVQGGDFRLYPEYPPEWEKAKCGFYKRTVEISDELLGKRLFLRFDALAFHAKVYFNGKLIGESMEAFLPLEFEITDVCLPGENELCVACESAAYLTYKGKDGRNRLDYPRGSFWGEFVSGIWQDVWLLAREKSYVEDVFAYADVEKRELTIRCRSCDARDGSVDFYLAPFKNGKAGKRKKIASLPQSDGTVLWSWEPGEVELWDFGQPNLYLLTAVLSIGGQVVDEKGIRIGFRTMRAEGEKFLLNGHPIALKIDAWHYMGYTIQTEEYARAYFRMALDAGVNIIRLHAEPFPEFFLDIADEMGMLIVSESAVWASHCMFSYSPDFFARCRDHLARMVLRDRNHPSVVIWSPENECIPAYYYCGSDYVRSKEELEEAIYDFLKVIWEYDPSRLISCDGSGDLGGRLPVNSLHYPHYDCPTKRGKPITIGEMGSMYYSTPDTVTREYGREALESFDGRLRAVAQDAFHDLTGQRKWASQICVFNLVWYGLDPLPFKDRKLTWKDYTTPGIKPSRITPYMRTLRAGAKDALPDYLPNPVWHMAKDAYAPVRPFIEDCPCAIWAGEEQPFRISVFSDLPHAAVLDLVAEWEQEGLPSLKQERKIPLDACTYREETVSFTVPSPGSGTLRVRLLLDGKCQFEEKKDLTVCDRQAFREEMERTGVKVLSDGMEETGEPVLDCRRPEPYAAFLHPVLQQRLFRPGQSRAFLDYGKPQEVYLFDEALPFAGVPVLWDGAGNALAVSLCKAGQRRILCGLDLSRPDAVTALAALYLAKTLSKEDTKKGTAPYFLGSPDSPAAVMLSEIGCEPEWITVESLKDLMRSRQSRLLILDESSGFTHPEWFSEHNFSKVLLTGMHSVPNLFASKVKFSPDRRFHLCASKEAERNFGLTSNALYGLEANRESALSDGTLIMDKPGSPILLGVPNIDWMCWNNVAEPIKTVSIRRTEKRDNSKLSALVHLNHAGTDFYLTTLCADTDCAKVKNIWTRILSGFGVELEMRSNDEVRNLVCSSMYASRVQKMLTRKEATVDNVPLACPGWNSIEQGNAWTAVSAKEGKVRKGCLYGFYVSSPQDRRDLLLNPDSIDLTLEADAESSLYLNGEKIGQGEKMNLTGIPLLSGWNRFVIRVSEESRMPRVSFHRPKKPQLDLTFSLWNGDLKPISMQGVSWFANVNNRYASHASFTRDHFWSTNENQKPGTALDISFPEPVRVRGLWYVALQFHNEGTNFTPARYRVLAGNTSDMLETVYESLPEAQMLYPRSRVLVDFGHTVQAKLFRYELLEDAGKQLVISDLTFFG